MSSDNVFERLFRQMASIYKMVVDGIRDPGQVSCFLQDIIDDGGDKTTQLISWRSFYRAYFGIELDLSSVKILNHQQGFNRLIVVFQGLTLNQVCDMCQKYFGCACYTRDLTVEYKDRNDREPMQTYAVWIRNRKEADVELRWLSANQLKDRKIQGITLLERLLYGLKYFSETGRHPDIQNWTLCIGSQNSEGNVPCVGWENANGIKILLFKSDNPCENVSSRAVIPCQ